MAVALRGVASVWRRSCMTAWVGAALGAAAAPPASLLHKDWELQCDNTRTCRAAGYAPEDTADGPVSLKITRAAGAATPIQMELRLEAEDGVTGTARMQVGSLRLTDLPLSAPDGGAAKQFSALQTQAALTAFFKADLALFQVGSQRWTLSLAGLNAVLLKMDEAQGRLGTPGALIRKGTRSEAEVLAPLPVPQIRAVVPVSTRPLSNAITQALLKAVPKSDYEYCSSSELQAKAYRLTQHLLLLTQTCEMGAYNQTELLWLAPDNAPYLPRLLQASGEFDPATGAAHYGMKGRGLGDCWHTQTWRFSGQGFTLADEGVDGACRGFVGGAWQLPVHVSRVIEPADVKTKQKGK